MRLVMAGLLALAIGLGLGAATRLSLGEPATASELRLSWRIRSEPVRVCRIRTPEELARLPVHMREEEVCERRALPYRLRVTTGDSVISDSVLPVSGGRGSRPVYVSSRFTLAPGVHAVRVEFARESDGAVQEGPPPATPGDYPSHAPPRQVATAFSVDTSLTFVAGRALVVTFDDQQQRLRVIGAAR